MTGPSSKSYLPCTMKSYTMIFIHTVSVSDFILWARGINSQSEYMKDKIQFLVNFFFIYAPEEQLWVFLISRQARPYLWGPILCSTFPHGKPLGLSYIRSRFRSRLRLCSCLSLCSPHRDQVGLLQVSVQYIKLDRLPESVLCRSMSRKPRVPQAFF